MDDRHGKSEIINWINDWPECRSDAVFRPFFCFGRDLWDVRPSFGKTQKDA